MANLKKNYIYNTFYQLMLLFLPIITVPYVSRILGTEGIGIYSYTYSIVYYFMIVAMLGINNYGNRTIAKSRDNKLRLSENFWGIYLIQIVMSVLMIIMYILFIFFFEHNYKTISCIQIIYLIANMFDINWFFFGLEKFRVTVTRSTIIKILSLILIFIFVKNNNDLWKYTLIMSGTTLLSQLLLIPFLLKEISLIKLNLKKITKHLKPIFILFIPVIAISLYKIMDKVMLGSICIISEVGLYEQAEKIVNIPLGLITSLGTVMLPRVSHLVENGKKEEILQYIEKSINFVMFLCFPIMLGIISISKNFVPLFLGNDFYKSYILLDLLSLTIVFLGFANILRTQYLIPYNRDKDYIISVFIGAIVNIIINLLLIPNLQSIGACIGTIFAEMSVCAYQSYSLRKELNIKKYLFNSIPFMIKALIMFLIVYLIGTLNFEIYLKIILQILFGVITYLFLNFKYIINLIDFKFLKMR